MNKNNLILTILIFLTVCFTQAQDKTSLSADQKQYILNTWYESPKESDENQITYRLTEYVVIVGQDYFAPTGKITFNTSGTFNSENFKSCEKNFQPLKDGKWIVSGSKLILNYGKEKCVFTISEIAKDKLTIKLINNSKIK